MVRYQGSSLLLIKYTYSNAPLIQISDHCSVLFCCIPSKFSIGQVIGQLSNGLVYIDFRSKPQ